MPRKVPDPDYLPHLNDTVAVTIKITKGTLPGQKTGMELDENLQIILEHPWSEASPTHGATLSDGAEITWQYNRKTKEYAWRYVNLDVNNPSKSTYGWVKLCLIEEGSYA